MSHLRPNLVVAVENRPFRTLYRVVKPAPWRVIEQPDGTLRSYKNEKETWLVVDAHGRQRHYLASDLKETSVKDVLDFQKAVAEQGNWVPASGGTEPIFTARSGKRLQYVYQPSTGKHAYLDVDSDIILSDEEAWMHLGRASGQTGMLVLSPRHPLNGARVAIVRVDPFQRFVVVKLDRRIGEYAAGSELQFKASEVSIDGRVDGVSIVTHLMAAGVGYGVARAIEKPEETRALALAAKERVAAEGRRAYASAKTIAGRASGHGAARALDALDAAARDLHAMKPEWPAPDRIVRRSLVEVRLSRRRLGHIPSTSGEFDVLGALERHGLLRTTKPKGAAFVETDLAKTIPLSAFDKRIVQQAKDALENVGRAGGFLGAPRGSSSRVRPGDRVRFTDARGTTRSGRVVMASSHAGAWVVNIGGRHGTPMVVDEVDLIVTGKGR